MAGYYRSLCFSQWTYRVRKLAHEKSIFACFVCVPIILKSPCLLWKVRSILPMETNHYLDLDFTVFSFSSLQSKFILKAQVYLNDISKTSFSGKLQLLILAFHSGFCGNYGRNEKLGTGSSRSGWSIRYDSQSSPAFPLFFPTSCWPFAKLPDVTGVKNKRSRH